MTNPKIHPKLRFIKEYQNQLKNIFPTKDRDERIEKLEIFCSSLTAFLQDNKLSDLEPAKKLIELFKDNRHLYEEELVKKKSEAILDYLEKKYTD